MKLQMIFHWVLAILFVVVGLAHFVAVDEMARFLPDWVPMKATGVIATGILEIVLAVGLCVPDMRKLAGKAVFFLLLLYTPLHVIDVMREVPVIGPQWVAIIRLPIQVVLLYMAWRVGWGNRQTVSV